MNTTWTNRKLDWRLTIILTFVFFSILYGFFLFFFPKQNSTTQLNTATPQNSQTSTEITPNNNTMQTLTTSFFTIQYPEDWKVEEFPSATSNRIIKPSSLAFGYYDPSISINIRKMKKDTIEDVKKIYMGLGYKEEKQTIDTISFYKFIGIFPLKEVQGKKIESPIFSTNYIGEKDRFLYSISYRYDGTQPDLQYEKIFQKMLTSLRFTR